MWWAVIGTALISVSLGFVAGIAYVFMDAEDNR